MHRLASLLLATAFAMPPLAAAQPADPRTLIASQTEAMRAFAMLDGIWRGAATLTQADGSRLSFTQTERIGPLLGGSIKVIEGRGYDDAGAVRFNAFAIVSFDPASGSYTLHSHALGRVGDFAFVPTADGYHWEIPLGPAATLRYVATVRNGELHEVGDHVAEGREPVRVFEMRLKRVGDTDWPAAGAVGPKAQ
ncbi:MAG TPA: DUF1579 domain-containing protein [Caldimonas sp.]|jgi:hypothetical protein